MSSISVSDLLVLENNLQKCEFNAFTASSFFYIKKSILRECDDMGNTCSWGSLILTTCE